MRNFHSLLLALVLPLSTSAVETPRQAWDHVKGVDAPESVFFDSRSGSVFVSNEGGTGDKKDGVGWIQKLSPEGKVVVDKWVAGLNSPKGMSSYKGILWVSDIDTLVSIDIKTAKVTGRYPAPQSKFLNDVAVGPDGTVFVSDTLGNKIFMLKNRKLTVFLEGETLEGPNGLLIKGDSLLVAGWGTGIGADWSTKTSGHLYRIHLKTKEISRISKAPLGNLDGLEEAPQGGFYVSDWIAGKVFFVDAQGDAHELLSGFKGAADIGYIPDQARIIVPRTSENKVTAYDIVPKSR